MPSEYMSRVPEQAPVLYPYTKTLRPLTLDPEAYKPCKPRKPDPAWTSRKLLLVMLSLYKSLKLRRVQMDPGRSSSGYK